MLKFHHKKIILIIFILLAFPLNSLNAQSFSKGIIGGNIVSDSEAKWTVGLLINNSDPYNSLFCGGTLIAKNWVLTAAHCCYGKTTSNIYIFTGNHDLKATSSEYEILNVKQIIIHEDYNYTSSDENDIALLELSSNATQSPISLQTTDPVVESTVRALGWGTTSTAYNASLSQYLMEVDMNAISNEVCKQSMGSWIISSMLCAGVPEGGKDSCSGDSGGPLVQLNGSEYKQVGIVSTGKNPCAAKGDYGVYTRVSSYISWITGKTGVDPNVFSVVTNEASLPIGLTSATLNGTITPAGAATTYYFEYGLDTSYGDTTEQESAGSGTNSVSVSKTISSGLTKNTTYHFRLVAFQGRTAKYGDDASFTTATETTTVVPAPSDDGGGSCFINSTQNF